MEVREGGRVDKNILRGRGVIIGPNPPLKTIIGTSQAKAGPFQNNFQNKLP